jgi:sulfur carrier protein ThiS
VRLQALNSLSQTMTITANGDQVTIKQETSVSTNEFTLTLGGAPVDYNDDLTGTKAKRHALLEGDKLTVVSENPDGVLTVVRTVEGNVLKAVITYKAKKDGTETVCNRFFNKK